MPYKATARVIVASLSRVVILVRRQVREVWVISECLGVELFERTILLWHSLFKRGVSRGTSSLNRWMHGTR